MRNITCTRKCVFLCMLKKRVSKNLFLLTRLVKVKRLALTAHWEKMGLVWN
jgi:hypothetical protein